MRKGFMETGYPHTMNCIVIVAIVLLKRRTPTRNKNNEENSFSMPYPKFPALSSEKKDVCAYQWCAGCTSIALFQPTKSRCRIIVFPK